MPLGEVVSHDPKSVLMSPGAGPAPPGSVALPGLAGGGGGVSVTVSNGGGYSHQVSSIMSWAILWRDAMSWQWDRD